MIHTVKGFGIVNKAEIDVFLELSFFFSDSADVGNLISDSSAFFKTSLNIWKFTVHGFGGDHHQMLNTQSRLIIFFAAKGGESLYSQQKQNQKLIVAQIMNYLLSNSELN